jgi:hypothetical protein
VKTAMKRDSSLVGCDVFLGDWLSTYKKDVLLTVHHRISV